MSEYPEDVMKAASNLYRRITSPTEEERMASLSTPIERIAAAIMAERLRCADLVQRIRFMDEFDRDVLLSEINQPGVNHMHETQWITSFPFSGASS